MTTPKRIEAFSRKYLLPHLPGWGARGASLFPTPIDHVYRGVLFDRWRWDKERFGILAFAMPLYVPQTEVGLTFARQLVSDWSVSKGGESAAAEAALRVIRRKAAPWLAKVKDPAGIAAVAHFKKGTEHQREAGAYGLLWSGRTRAFRDAVAPLLQELEEMRADEDYGRRPGAWWNRQYARINTVTALAAENPAAVKAQLDKWSRQTAKALKLATFAPSESRDGATTAAPPRRRPK